MPIPTPWDLCHLCPCPRDNSHLSKGTPRLTGSFGPGLPGGSEVKASASNEGDIGSIAGLGRSPGEGNGNPLQYFAWRIPWTEEPGRLQSMGSQNQTQLSDFTSFHFTSCLWSHCLMLGSSAYETFCVLSKSGVSVSIL